MDIVALRPPSQWSDDFKRIVKLLTIGKCKLQLLGSASLSSQRYYADYDLVCFQTDLYKMFTSVKQVIESIKKDPSLYFIECKIQSKKGKKVRWTPKKELTKEEFDDAMKDIDYLKIDLVAWCDSQFTEVSCNYYPKPPSFTTEMYVDDLKKDIKGLSREGQWFKILKRYFSIYRALKQKDKLIELTKIFNGELGQEYKVISNLKTICLLLNHYHDQTTIKKVEVNLKDLKLEESIPNVNTYVERRLRSLNSKAKKLYPDFNLKL
jgi:hypothetical protein